MALDLSRGLFFAVTLFTLTFFRLLCEERMADALQPTLLILAAPFASGLSSYLTTTRSTASIDLSGQAFYMLMLVTLAFFLGRIRLLDACCPFRFVW